MTKDDHRPYPPETQWTYRSRQTGHTRTGALRLSWEAHYDPISDDHLPEELDASELLNMWLRRLREVDVWDERLGEGWVRIWWYIDGDGGTFEGAPFGAGSDAGDDFLTVYDWPRHAETGEPVNWLRLPVIDKLWHKGRLDKGGFIQQATGWKPSAFQTLVNVDTLSRAIRG